MGVRAGCVSNLHSERIASTYAPRAGDQRSRPVHVVYSWRRPSTGLPARSRGRHGTPDRTTRDGTARDGWAGSRDHCCRRRRRRRRNRRLPSHVTPRPTGGPEDFWLTDRRQSRPLSVLALDSPDAYSSRHELNMSVAVPHERHRASLIGGPEHTEWMLVMRCWRHPVTAH